MSKKEFEARISSLDTSLFDQIESHTSQRDRRALLNIQNIVRSFKDSYIYLEIGSHLGGSIQPHLLDRKCRKIFSIDKRPLVQPDVRWEGGDKYPGNSTQRMFDNLRRLSTDLSKITCFDSDASEIDKNTVTPKPDICFIDGEHTNKKVVPDFEFCASVLNKNGVIIFHDAGVVSEGIRSIIDSLRRKKVKFEAVWLPDSIFLLDFTNNNIIFKRIRFQNFIKTVRDIYSKFPQPLKNIVRPFLRVFKPL